MRGENEIAISGTASASRNIPTCVGKTRWQASSLSASQEHPHMRGENPRFARTGVVCVGTSPHAWGKRYTPAHRRGAPRNIPTCVGKTTRRRARLTRESEHPHMRGENRPSRSRGDRIHGTSPHAWGKQIGDPRLKLVDRNIPTCVGKTDGRPEKKPALPEHPHMRGENFAIMKRTGEMAGTSPHAWGKHREGAARVARNRNIPTCVGKTVRRRRRRDREPEHPHMRGENSIPRKVVGDGVGTSPHAWGKRQPDRKGQRARRNIPTCVGKTDHGRYSSVAFQEHPHMRGENHYAHAKEKHPYGTSPHAWGKHLRPCKFTTISRNIPTCVGKTDETPASLACLTEHPHMRGENHGTRSCVEITDGTSPHAWGKLGSMT